MKYILRTFVVVLLTLFAFGIIQPGAVSAQSVNDFSITGYTIDYYVGQNSEKRSTLKTVETIVASFPVFDQNHGIERAIPAAYDGHPTNLAIQSITDKQGKKLNYTAYDSNGNRVIRIGDADRYVHGTQTYNITYTQLDVTKYFANSKDDEFYWDTNGTEWRVPINNFSATVHFENGLSGKLSDKQGCYNGASGSNTACGITRSGDAFTTSVAYLAPGENITLAFGFPAGTFAGHKTSIGELLTKYWLLMTVLSFPLGVISTVIVIVMYARASSRRRERTSIVAEYLPPPDTSVAVAASIYGRPASVFSAQLIDYAVRGYTKIYQTREKSFFRNAQYDIEIIRDISSLHDEEQEIFRDIFPATAIGTRLRMQDLKKNAGTISLKVSDNQKKLDAAIRGTYALRGKDPVQKSRFKRAALILLAVSILTLSFWIAFAALVSFVMAFTISPLTDKGLALWHYLEGLKMYIGTAEVDRIKMLQSPEGAEKTGQPVNANDPAQLVKLYERVLPYAILFGQEKEWNKQLGQYYEITSRPPDWYAGSYTAFNAAAFSSGISSFNTTASYTTASSSSSGGSGGGGSSGGGGGGGGGGGW